MNKLALTAATPDYDQVRDLALGRVTPEGIDLTFLTFPVEEIFYRFIVYKEWDVSEISMAKYVSLIAQGDESFWALPVFPSRVFRHSSLYVRRGGPIKKITDLAGRKVGIPEWAQTAAVYSRGLLAHEYGLKLSSIDWIQAGVNQPGRVEKVDLKLPKGVKITSKPEKSLNGMLLSGEIDAVLAARPPDAFLAGDPKIRRFFENYQEVEQAYYKKTGIFPIMHAVAVRREVLDKHPWVARNLLSAFDEARRAHVRVLPHRGGTVLSLGIVSLCLFFVPAIALALGIGAVVMGNIDLAKMRKGDMDPGGRGLTRAGVVCGILGPLLTISAVALFCLITILTEPR